MLTSHLQQSLYGQQELVLMDLMPGVKGVLEMVRNFVQMDGLIMNRQLVELQNYRHVAKL